MVNNAVQQAASIPVPFDFRLFAEWPRRGRRLLMLDYDGTLAPFHSLRAEALPYPGVTGALSRLLDAGHTRVVIVSGRPIHELRSLLGPDLPLELFGAHGWERRYADGRIVRWEPPQPARDVLKEAHARLAAQVPPEQLEVKRGAVMLHTRAMTSAEQKRMAALVTDEWQPLSSNAVALRTVDGGFEMRALERTKGTVVETLRRECTPPCHCAYLGDDLTDEDAFRQLSPPDWPILVRPEPRASCARYWLQPPGDLLRFLETWTRSASAV
ncbi:MAG: trehalose-phosphatase [Candidatus Zixiibacteriota bacterium]